MASVRQGTPHLGGTCTVSARRSTTAQGESGRDSAPGARGVEQHRLADQRLERPFVDLFAAAEVDRPAGRSFEA